MREKFLADRLPPGRIADDYDAAGNVQLGPEYADWFRSAENSVRDRAVLAAANDALQITSPLPGSVYLVDPDVPSTKKIPLIANGGTEVEWQSESLSCRSESGRDFALAADGEHRILVTDRASAAARRPGFAFGRCKKIPNPR